MRVAGFSFIKNAILNDYPIAEAIQSVLPLCDAFYVAVGASDDATLDLVKSISSAKIYIIETTWDESLRVGGRVLAEETNKAFDAIPADFDWCFYIQGDEVLHEDGIAPVRAALALYKNEKAVQGLLFKYRHFYGSYDYIGASRKWYRREVRIIRNDKKIRSFRDAQGFRYAGNKKLRVKLIDAYMHHYGWVRHPKQQQKKQQSFNKLWHSDSAVEKKIGNSEQYSYDGAEPLQYYKGKHPKVMQARIAAMNWHFEHIPEQTTHSVKERILAYVEKLTGWRIGEYRNYKEL